MTGTRTGSTGSHVAAVIAARVVAGAVGAVTTLLVARNLHPADYGAYGIAIGVAGMLVVLSDLGLTTATARYLAEGSLSRGLLLRATVRRFAAAAIAGGAIAAMGAAVQFGWIAHEKASSHQLDPAFLYLAAALVVANSVLGVALGLLPSMRRIGLLGVVTIVQPVLELAGMLVAIRMGGGGAGIILASAVAALAVGAVALVVAVRAVPRFTAGIELRTIRAYSRPMFLVTICFAVFGQVDQLVLWWFHGNVAAATYIANWKLITMLHLPGLAAGTVVAPRLAGRGPQQRGMYLRWLSLLGVIYAGVTAVAMALAPLAVPLALGSAYRSAAGVFVALGLYAFLLGLAPHVTMAANYLGGASQRVRLSLVTIATNVVLDLLLVPPFGAYGAAAATSIAFAWYVGAHVVLSYRLMGGRLRRHAGVRPMWELRGAVASTLWVAGAIMVAVVATNAVVSFAPLAWPDALRVGAAGVTGLAAYATLLVVGWNMRGRPSLNGAMAETGEDVAVHFDQAAIAPATVAVAVAEADAGRGVA